MMKILFVSSGKKIGSCPIVSSQASSLNKLGLNVKHFTIEKKGLLGYIKELFRLRECLSKEKFHVIHAHYGLSGIICVLTFQREPLVISFMGDDLLGSTTSNPIQKLLSKFLVFTNKLLARYAYDYIIVKSRQMLKSLRLKGENFSILPNGVDLDLFTPYINNPTSKKSIILFAADPLRQEKNFELAKEAVSRLKRPDASLVTVFNQPQENLVKYLNDASVLILTSLHEGSPNIIKEAMACNCPIVTTDVGDVKWVLGQTDGCFISSFCPASFSQKIENALVFAETKGRTHGRDRIINLNLDSKSIAIKLCEIYSKIIGK